MSQVYALGAKVMCNSIAGLVSFQRQLCRENPDVMVSIGKGAKLGIDECQHQFADQRWNCSTIDRDASLFGKVMRRGKSQRKSKLSFTKFTQNILWQKSFPLWQRYAIFNPRV